MAARLYSLYERTHTHEGATMGDYEVYEWQSGQTHYASYRTVVYDVAAGRVVIDTGRHTLSSPVRAAHYESDCRRVEEITGRGRVVRRYSCSPGRGTVPAWLPA